MTTHRFVVEMDDEQSRAWAGLVILDAVDDPRAWALFWRAVTVARTSHHSLGSDEVDGPRG